MSHAPAQNDPHDRTPSGPTLLPPSLQLVWRAVDVYLSVAYEGGAAPGAVQARLQKLRPLESSAFYASDVLERDPSATPVRWRLRLGNTLYPHMKLVIEPRPDGAGYLFRADAHDRHCCPPPESREHGAFCQLMDANRDFAERIEHAWGEAGIATFKSYLHEDLARRVSGQT